MLFILLGLEHNYSFPTASMQPSVMMGDVVPFRLTHLYGGGTPLAVPEFERGDLVIFPPGAFEPGVVYVKRVVGIAGDRVRLEGGLLVINDVTVERRALGTFTDVDSGGTAVEVVRYEERLPGGAVHLINEVSDAETLDNVGEITVPAGYLFVMGDNRDRSADSRLSEIGLIKVTDIVAFNESSDQLFFWNRQ